MSTSKLRSCRNPFKNAVATSQQLLEQEVFSSFAQRRRLSLNGREIGIAETYDNSAGGFGVGPPGGTWRWDVIQPGGGWVI